MGITAAELASMRAEAAALVLPDTCAIYGMSNTTDAYGDPVLTETLRDTVACALSIESRASQDNAILAQRESSAAFYTLSVGYDTTIEAEDKIVANNKVFRVITLHESQAFMMVKRALVEHTGTAAISLTVEATAQANASTYNAGEVDEDEVVTLTITVTNTGDVLLTLAEPTDSGAVTIGAWSDTTLAPHGTATATVTLNTGTAGAQTGYVEFTSDATPSPYRVNFGFEVASAAVPEIRVVIDGSTIADGGTYAAGSSNWTGSDITEIVTIHNDGDADLTVTSPPSATGDVTAGAISSTTITPGNSATFTMTISATTSGAKSGTLSIVNDDADENPYNINVSATVVFNPNLLTSPVAAIDFHESGSSLFQDSAGTTPATANNDPIGYAAQITGFSATPAIQATTAAKPTLKTGVNGINGHNAASLDGGDTLIWTGITAASGAKTFYIVASPTSALGTQDYFISFNNTGFIIAHLTNSANQTGYYDGTFRSIAAAATGAQILSFVLGGGTGTVYRNNVSLGSAAYTDKSIENAVVIGANHVPADFYTGLFGAVYIYNAAHSAAERAAMHAYLSARWGIS